MKSIRKTTTILLLIPILLLTAFILEKTVLYIPKELYLFNAFIIALFSSSILISLIYLIYAIIKKWKLRELNTFDKIKWIVSVLITGFCLLAWGLIFVVTSS